MKAVVVIAFYVWLALTVAIVLGRLARWTAGQQAARRRRKARQPIVSTESPITSLGSVGHNRSDSDLIDLDAATRPPVATPAERSVVTGTGLKITGSTHSGPTNVPVGSRPLDGASMSASDTPPPAEAETPAEAEERRAQERRNRERRAGERRGGDRRSIEANGSDQPLVDLPSPVPPTSEPTDPQPALGVPSPVPAEVPAATSPAPAPPASGPTLAHLLAGFAFPVDLLPIVADGSTPNDQSVSLICGEREAGDVGSGLADELERLGYGLAPINETTLRATRGDDVLTVQIDPTPDRADASGHRRFPAASAGDVVVDFWVGSGERPS